MDYVLKHLADLGRIEAKVRFEEGLAQYQYDADVEVRVEAIKNGYKIVAHSNGVNGNEPAVAFLEFGAGAAFGFGHPAPYADGQAFGPGTYNPGSDAWKTGWYAIENGKATFTLGNPPSQGMYSAFQKIYMADIKSIFETALTI